MEEEGSTLKLIMEKGPREGETLEFRPGSAILIGRLVRGNTLAIKDSGISSKHLSIESKSGKWIISDLDSSNGTVLNGSKLAPLSPSDLGDGDTIKIGECTSIKVKIEVHGGDYRLRRNPRRGASKDGKSDSVGVVIENRSRKGGGKANLASIAEDNELRLGIGGVLRNASEVQAVNQTCRARGRGRPGRARVVKCEPQEISSEVEKVEKLENGGPTEPKQGRQASTRRTRSSTKEENSCLDGNGSQEVDTSAQIVDKMTRGGLRKKRNLRLKVPESVQNEILEEEGDVEKVEENVLNGQSEAVQTDILEDNESVERGREGCEKLATALGNKESCVEAGDEPDLEKMTLGEWFDYLEVYLPKQIYDETEEMILSMEQKAEQFHELILQQKNDKEKGKLPMG